MAEGTAVVGHKTYYPYHIMHNCTHYHHHIYRGRGHKMHGETQRHNNLIKKEAAAAFTSQSEKSVLSFSFDLLWSIELIYKIHCRYNLIITNIFVISFFLVFFFNSSSTSCLLLNTIKLFSTGKRAATSPARLQLGTLEEVHFCCFFFFLFLMK